MLPGICPGAVAEQIADVAGATVIRGAGTVPAFLRDT